MAVGLGVSPGECAQFMVHGVLGTDKGWRCVDNKGENVSKKMPADESTRD